MKNAIEKIQSDDEIEQAIIDDITEGDAKVSFFPLGLHPEHKKYLEKHYKDSGKESLSSFIIEMFEAFFNDGVFIYTKETNVNNVLNSSLRNLGTNLNQAVARLRSDKVMFQDRFGDDKYKQLLDDIKTTFVLIRSAKKFIKQKYKLNKPGHSIQFDSAIRDGNNGRPKVKVKKVRTKLYFTDEQREFFDSKKDEAECKQLSKFLRDVLIEKHDEKKLQFLTPTRIKESYRDVIKMIGTELNGDMASINTVAKLFLLDIAAWKSFMITLPKMHRALKAIGGTI